MIITKEYKEFYPYKPISKEDFSDVVRELLYENFEFEAGMFATRTTFSRPPNTCFKMIRIFSGDEGEVEAIISLDLNTYCKAMFRSEGYYFLSLQDVDRYQRRFGESKKLTAIRNVLTYLGKHRYMIEEEFVSSRTDFLQYTLWEKRIEHYVFTYGSPIYSCLKVCRNHMQIRAFVAGSVLWTPFDYENMDWNFHPPLIEVRKNIEPVLMDNGIETAPDWAQNGVEHLILCQEKAHLSKLLDDLRRNMP